MNREPNVQQKKVIAETERNVLLFAGAGTGKTFTVARRVEHILSRGLAQPEQILCLTFTIKAADEMRADLMSYAGARAADVWCGTIHSFACRILKEESARDPDAVPPFFVCDENDSAELLLETALELGYPETGPAAGYPAALAGISSAMKHGLELLKDRSGDEQADFTRVYEKLGKQNKLQPLETVRYSHDGHLARLLKDHAGEFMHGYCEKLRVSGMADFDDLICGAYRLLSRPDRAQEWRGRFRWLIVDEMQDTSVLEYGMLRQLFPGNRVMMCGDYFQTIYQWRGSVPERVIEDFSKTFSARRFAFSCNYRSTQTLVQAGFGYLKNSFPDLLGSYLPENMEVSSPEKGEKILHVSVPAGNGQARWILDRLRKDPPKKPGDVCILSRSNAKLEKLYNELTELERNRPPQERLRFFCTGSEHKVLQNKSVRDVLAFFRVLLNPSDEFSMKRILGKYVSGVGKATLEKLHDMGEYGISAASAADPDLFRYGDPYASLLTAAEEGRVVVYDTETTGLDQEKDQIIQLSAIRLGKSGQVTAALDRFVMPTVPICPEAERTHHQNLDTLRAAGAGDIASALKEFSEFARDCVLVGHNSLRFDAPLTARQLRECGLPPFPVLRQYDTMYIARQLLPKSPNYKLDTLCGHFGVVNEEAHNAMGDIEATGKVLWAMLPLLRDSAAQRMLFLQQYRSAFAKLFEFLESLRQDMAHGADAASLARRIIDTCAMRGKKAEPGDLIALDEFLVMLEDRAEGPAAVCLARFLEQTVLRGSQLDTMLTRMKRIPVITVHQSKGCEFDTVIITDAGKRSFPSGGLDTPEERRVFYVAVTRAKRRLILLRPREWDGHRMCEIGPSPYTGMIPAEYLEEAAVSGAPGD